MLRNRRPFVIGEKLKVISNENKFINLQNRCRGYSSIRMSHLPGSYVTIVHFTPTEVLVEKDRFEYYLHPETLDIYTAMFDAISNGDEEKLLKLLYSANLNAQNEFGQTPIHLACALGQINIVKLLIPFNPDVNIPDYNGDLPIHTIIQLKHYEIIKYLIENVTDILESKNSRGQSVQDIVRNEDDPKLNTLISFKFETIANPQNQCQSVQPVVYTEYTDTLEVQPIDSEYTDTLEVQPIDSEYTDTFEFETIAHQQNQCQSLQTIPIPSKQSPPEPPDVPESIPEDVCCQICTCRIKTIILVCGHMVCRDCSPKLLTCPFCRQIAKVFSEYLN